MAGQVGPRIVRSAYNDSTTYIDAIAAAANRDITGVTNGDLLSVSRGASRPPRAPSPAAACFGSTSARGPDKGSSGPLKRGARERRLHPCRVYHRHGRALASVEA